ncbi:hypothetical protein [Desulfovibrio ferrophilus]|uniref:Uncharacterized protein n=1 Tax=Desulfovibrio ferrophilus TaxID=241368 RepID=A0A2Z6AUN2_9BACT|nr:hypothetical protein [Desulfovibrio ferrophilus]BBD06944.1 uncharacterized protein DFE_0218 [Desulfovibrio ferrophilus]
MRQTSQRLAKRIALSLIILSAALAICAIAFHRIHNMDQERALELMAETVSMQAIKSAHWLDTQEAIFRTFAADVTLEQALAPASAMHLTTELQSKAPLYIDLSVVNDTGRTLWGGTSTGSMHGNFLWFKDATGPDRFAGGIYPAPDGTPRILFSRRLTEEGRGWHLRGEVDATALSTLISSTEAAGWVLVGAQGPAISLAGMIPNPGLTLRLGEACREPLPLAKRLNNGWLVAATNIPERKTALAVVMPEPSTPYKNIGLALTIMAAVCLAYAGYIRARALKN